MDTERYKNEVLPIKDKLYRFALRLLGDSEEARDAVQETFLKLWKLRDKLDTYRSLEAFSMTMIKNYCLDKIKARRTVSIEQVYIQPQSDENDTDEKRYEIAETYNRVKKLMDVLPEQQRVIIQLRDVEGYEFEEISEITDMNVNAIRVNLSRARKRIKELYFNEQNYGKQENKGFAGKVL
jgi:RNA polymerase sigma factor (sigma-70 family)